MQTQDGDVIPCDLVAVAVGVRPRVELARAAGLPCARGVLVDEYLRAGDPDIYAAGDIAEIADPESGRGVLDVLWNVAVAKGTVAGLNMATEPRQAYSEDKPLNVTRLAGLHTTIIGTVGNGGDADLQGLSRGDSQVWSELRRVGRRGGRSAARPTCALALGERTIDGAVVMGDQALSFPLQELIEARVDVSAAERVLDDAAGRTSICDARGDWAACRA